MFCEVYFDVQELILIKVNVLQRFGRGWEGFDGRYYGWYCLIVGWLFF